MKPGIATVEVTETNTKTASPADIETSTNTIPVLPTATGTTTPSNTPTKRPTRTITPTLSPTLTETPTLTPLPTIAQSEVHDYVIGMIETNGGCELPCWWGITPGETTWGEAKQIIETFTEVEYRVYAEVDESGKPYELVIADWVYVLSETPRKVVSAAIYSINGQITDTKYSLSPEANDRYLLHQVLTEYGEPARTLILPMWAIPLSSSLDIVLLYDNRFYVHYMIEGEVKDEEFMSYCIPAHDLRVNIETWSDDYDMTIKKIQERWYGSAEEIWLKPINEYTDMTEDMFYDAFSSPDTYECILVPLHK